MVWRRGVGRVALMAVSTRRKVLAIVTPKMVLVLAVSAPEYARAPPSWSHGARKTMRAILIDGLWERPRILSWTTATALSWSQRTRELCAAS